MGLHFTAEEFSNKTRRSKINERAKFRFSFNV
jgi:hypothetical protein